MAANPTRVAKIENTLRWGWQAMLAKQPNGLIQINNLRENYPELSRAQAGMIVRRLNAGARAAALLANADPDEVVPKSAFPHSRSYTNKGAAPGLVEYLIKVNIRDPSRTDPRTGRPVETWSTHRIIARKGMSLNALLADAASQIIAHPETPKGRLGSTGDPADWVFGVQVISARVGW